MYVPRVRSPANATGRRLATEQPEEDSMAYRVTCADTGADCPGDFIAPTKDELIKHVEMHAQVSHPDLELTDELVEGLVKSV